MLNLCSTQRSLETVRHAPGVAIVPLLLFCIMTALGIWAVVLSATTVNSGIMRNAIAVAESTVMSLELSLYVTLQPALVTASFVRQFPQWVDMAPRFETFAQEIYLQAVSAVSVCETISPLFWGGVLVYENTQVSQSVCRQVPILRKVL